MDATTAFFQGVAQRGHEPMLANVAGSIRIEVRNGRRVEGRTLHIEHGDLRLSDEPEADCRMVADRDLFNRLASGQTNALAAVMRGALAIEGNLELLVLFQRLLPGRNS